MENNTDVIQMAKGLLLKSPVMKYGITEEKIEELFKNVHMMPSREALEEEYNPFEKYNGKLEGFNRNHHCYFGPDATPHVIIHELLHEISSEFDERGHRAVNGIAKNDSYSQILLNEGMIDYLASKISGEEVWNYATEKTAISRLEPMLIKQSGNPDVLFKILLQDKKRINDFIEKFANTKISNKIINGFQFMDKEDINEAMEQIEKRFNRHHKFEQLKARISSVFHRKKALPPGTQAQEQQIPQEQNKVKDFKAQYGYNVQSYPTINLENEQGNQQAEIEEEQRQE